MARRPGFPLLVCGAALFFACTGPRPLPQAPRPKAPRSQDFGNCYNLPYGFTCVPPPDFVLTQEGPGPGEVMTLVRRSQSSQDEPYLKVIVRPLRMEKLEDFAEKRLARPYAREAGLNALEPVPAKIGDREGYGLEFKRLYATGAFLLRVFCFERGENAFIVEYAVPEARAAKDPGALESFVRSLAFR